MRRDRTDNDHHDSHLQARHFFLLFVIIAALQQQQEQMDGLRSDGRAGRYLILDGVIRRTYVSLGSNQTVSIVRPFHMHIGQNDHFDGSGHGYLSPLDDIHP